LKLASFIELTSSLNFQINRYPALSRHSGMESDAVRRYVGPRRARSMYSAPGEPSTPGWLNARNAMPHIIAEYSANLEDSLDVQGLVDDLHQAAIDSQVAELLAIRTRAVRREFFRVADGKAANGFVHITARLRIGRSEEQRTRLGQLLLAAADNRLTNVYPAHPLGLTVEIHEISDMTFRRNTLRERADSAA
jgi:5-carboxymethyl-2-hydroxymuconate isomerase